MEERRRNFFQQRKDAFLADALFHDNEVHANRMMVLALLCCGIILIAVWVASEAGIFQFARDVMNETAMQGLVEIAFMCVVARIVRHDAWWLKYLLLFGMTLLCARVDSMLTHKAELLMAIPVICSCRYFSRKLTIWMAVLTTAMFALSAAYGASHGLLNLNDLTLPLGTTMTTTGLWIDSAVEQVGYDKALYTRNVMLYSYLPKWLIFSIAAVISARIARRGREMVLEQKRMAEKSARIQTELTLATKIQEAFVPHAFPDRAEFDLYAVMDPAKEVGGDFYDFFMIDDDHLCLLIADVSGKGVPAALFMMVSKIILQSCAMLGKSTAEILTKTNEAICSNNQAQMFVTIWLGILEISTGRLTAANAGHEYPALRRANGAYELYKDKHGFVVGGMDGVRYRDYEIRLEPGDQLFVYTDGVPEATDAENRAFGNQRMLEALNRRPVASPAERLKDVRQAVDAFVGTAEQFDDLTMLCLEYRGAGVGGQG